MKELLRAGDFKEYVDHLAFLAGIFCDMSIDTGNVLLTDEEKSELDRRWTERDEDGL